MFGRIVYYNFDSFGIVDEVWFGMVSNSYKSSDQEVGCNFGFW